MGAQERQYAEWMLGQNLLSPPRSPTSWAPPAWGGSPGLGPCTPPAPMDFARLRMQSTPVQPSLLSVQAQLQQQHLQLQAEQIQQQQQQQQQQLQQQHLQQLQQLQQLQLMLPLSATPSPCRQPVKPNPTTLHLTHLLNDQGLSAGPATFPQ